MQDVVFERATTDDGIPPAVGRTSRWPLVTLCLSTVAIVASVGFMLDPSEPSWEKYERWGAISPVSLRHGAPLGLLTSTFLHPDPLHLIFNLYWLWILGSLMERAVGAIRFLGFFLAAAVLASGAELCVSDSTGVGASGAVYAIFGFLWIARSRWPEFAKVVTLRTALVFVAWMGFCFVTTLTHVWTVGNAAHLNGVLFGSLVAAVVIRPRLRVLAIAGIVLLVAITVVPLFWAPWSATWVGERASAAHGRHDFATAEKLYGRFITLGGDKTWGLENLALVYDAEGKSRDRDETLSRLRAIDATAAERVDTMLSGQGTGNPNGDEHRRNP